MPIPCRRSFQRRAMRRAVLCGIRPSFPGLFPCRGQVAYVLLTSAPVVIRSVATPMLPLDLHVLSLSLAFILSQDQTLRCQIFFFSLSFKRLNKDTRHASSRPRRMSVLLATFQGKQRGDFFCPCSLCLLYYVFRCCTISMNQLQATSVAKSGAKLLPFTLPAKFFNKKINTNFERFSQQAVNQ